MINAIKQTCQLEKNLHLLIEWQGLDLDISVDECRFHLPLIFQLQSAIYTLRIRKGCLKIGTAKNVSEIIYRMKIKGFTIILCVFGYTINAGLELQCLL